MSDKILHVGDQLCDYYLSKLNEHGPTLAGVDWTKETDANLRYGLLHRSVKLTDASSVLDVGSGLGHFYRYLLEKDPLLLNRLGYQGVEPVAAMLSNCRNLNPGVSFELGRVENLSKFEADIVMANGLFTVRGNSSETQMQQFLDLGLEQMWKAARVGIVFNLMSDFVENRYDRLFYLSPAEVISRYSKKFGRHFMIFGDSKLFDIFYLWLKNPLSTD